MWVKSLHLSDFRSYAALDITFEGGVNCLVGSNGQGKTNVIEAIGYLATLQSHRVASDAPLVRLGADHAVIGAVVSHEDRHMSVEIQINAGRANRAKLNRTPVTRVRDIVGVLRTVVFSPEDLSLVKGDPGERRNFLDELLTLRTPRIAGLRADVDRVLKQRNALLKSAAATGMSQSAADTALAVWDEQYALHAAELLHERVHLLQQLQPLVADRYRHVAGDVGLDVAMRYQSSVAGTDDHTPGPDEMTAWTPMHWQQRLLEQLRVHRRQELARAVTVVGPHRDEIALSIAGMPARAFLSHGESWSLALSLRLASYDLLVGDDIAPVLILDDVFAELDDVRRAHLVDAVTSATQSFITAAVEHDIPAQLHARRYVVTKGQVSDVRPQ